MQEPETDPSLRLEPAFDADDELEQARAQRDFWRHVFDDLVAEFPEPVLVVDDDGRVTHWNEPQAEMLDVSSDEARGRVAHDVIGTDDVTETLAEKIVRVERTIREEEIRSGETADGEPWHVRAAGTPVTTPDGEVVGCFEFVTRVTDVVEQREAVERVQRRISETVRDTLDALLEITGEVDASSDRIESMSAEQVDKLTAVREDVESLSASVEEIASSAEEVSQQSAQVETLAIESGSDIETVVELMTEIEASAERLEENSRTLEARVAEIDRVVDIINDVAERINILALNANIEAARSSAGGDGFAVVANEIKDLAEESKSEANTIEDIVSEIHRTTERTAESVAETTDRLDRATRRAEGVAENQTEIEHAITEASAGADQIAEATDQQAMTATDVAAVVAEVLSHVEDVADEVRELSDRNQTQVEAVERVDAEIGRLEDELADRQ